MARKISPKNNPRSASNATYWIYFGMYQRSTNVFLHIFNANIVALSIRISQQPAAALAAWLNFKNVLAVFRKTLVKELAL
ncbi:hypothetical protein EDD18DRAFT_1352139 [Armillaria luteobubalina]|uniref:Uncharacterized protein n=1 Tax=Armillaria luteobubalina TaxID=153913 RepID=A0AA39Q2P3_9AGAR|nr:hypothetical protein EDD18DRAFT_1363137 [Armillaria luteobubalina]KAK0486716.1 hypothetical protein EDD18DRAFT_1360594 [Armillaria luteobubalina]KAK0495124.1 hypothetical protein EDD18DRAFT_1354315 [Armillaria luteobubalina]KAK0495127.1 hypothetical protein EDD18DRAFT_1354318 [Armillaria luteobubalina]KAK0497285.1 hypothetical protein EDD18DRAFT_1352139 [Armillaria luteobubalina]